jgi:hypothetical protein
MAGQPGEERARSIYERWQNYLTEARSALGSDAHLERVLHRAIARWREHEAPELAFVAEELSAERRETRHETLEDELLEGVARGDLVAVRRRSDGEVHYLAREDYELLNERELARLDPYDPLLARAIRRRALEESTPPGE